MPAKKHPCPDCQFCQFCADTRCAACRGTCTRTHKPCLSEQIRRYEALNPEQHDPAEPIYYKKTPTKE